MKLAKMAAFVGLLATAFACTSQEQTQNQFTRDTNYFDYEYYGDREIRRDTTFPTPYDYPYYEEPEYFYDDAEPYPPVMLRSAEPDRPADSWYFDDD